MPGMAWKAPEPAGLQWGQLRGYAPRYDPYGMELDDLPTPVDVASDLMTLVHSLKRFRVLRLPYLEALPSVRSWRPLGQSEQHSGADWRTLAIESCLGDVLQALPQDTERLALEKLITLGDLDRDLKDRQDDAAAVLGASDGDSFRKSREKLLLEAFAVQVYRHELLSVVHAYKSLLDPYRMGTSWWRTLEEERAVTITAERPSEQLWEYRNLLRCMVPVAQPIYIALLPWTGSGPHKIDTVTVLSGPQRDDSFVEFSHRLLSIRRETPSARMGAMAYIWDLGVPLGVGDEVEIRFTQILVDHESTFRPHIGLFTREDTITRRICLRACVPPDMAVNPRGEMNRTPDWHRLYQIPQREWSPPVEMIRFDGPDSDGFFVYEPASILPGHDYTLSFGPTW